MSAHSFDAQGQHCPFIPVFGAPQVMFERGLGTELWDTDGKRYLDFLGGLAVTALGHSNPVIAAAICEQASTLMHVSNLFANPVATEAAQMVNALLHECTGAVGQTFFCTLVPKPTRPRSSWRASSAAAAVTRWCRRTAASMAAPWLLWPPQGNRPSTSRSFQCPMVSAT